MATPASAPSAKADLTDDAAFAEAVRRAENWYRPGSGAPCDLLDLAISPDGRHVAASAVIVDRLEGQPSQRIAIVDADTAALTLVTAGPRVDRQPRWSPDGAKLLYLSDRAAAYDFQLFVRDVATGAECGVAIAGHFVEAAWWSPDGRRILIHAAGTGVDLAGAQGGIPSPLASNSTAPSWAPAVDTGWHDDGWRSIWTCDAEGGALSRVSPHGVTVWEACWCGPDAAVIVASDRPNEEDWYRASLRKLDLGSGALTTVHQPDDQLGWPCANADGTRIAVVEAVCSDRTIVAGNLLIGTANALASIETHGVDVTWACWVDRDSLLYAGHRGFETVLCRLDVATDRTTKIWCSTMLTFGGARYPEAGACSTRIAMMVEGHFSRPCLCLIEGGAPPRALFRPGEDDHAHRMEAAGTATAYRWKAPDGLEIQGWLLRPAGSEAAAATIIDIHGGPVWLWRPRFVGRVGFPGVLLEADYSVLQPNIRGSSGRGQDYARRVFGDMGGADTGDILSACDALVAAGIADPKRIGLTGGSYGGFMSSWLVTRDRRFAAAVPMAPVTDWVSEHLTCHIGIFCEMFLADDMRNLAGRYFSRSPIMFADRVETPVLLSSGALDQNTPPGQALEFHRALQQYGKTSVLLTYPGEGHGVRKMPAIFDCQARMLGWFRHYMPA